MNRSLFDEGEDTIVQTALESLQINDIDYTNDEEVNRITTVVIAVNCIVHGNKPVSEETKKNIEERIVYLCQILPKASNLYDYPRAIQLRNILEKIKDSFADTTVVRHIDKVIGVDV